MPAEYIGTSTVRPFYKNGLTAPIPLSDSDQERIAQRIAALGSDEIDGINEEAFGGGSDEAEIRSSLTAAVEELLIDGRPTDFTILSATIESGGMSWGDSPTESFDTINLLEASGICHTALDDESSQLLSQIKVGQELLVGPSRILKVEAVEPGAEDGDFPKVSGQLIEVTNCEQFYFGSGRVTVRSGS